MNGSYVLEGTQETVDPSREDIEREVSSLRLGDGDYVALKHGQTTIQTMPTPGHEERFVVEVFLSDGTFRVDALDETDVVRLFVGFLEGEAAFRRMLQPFVESHPDAAAAGQNVPAQRRTWSKTSLIFIAVIAVLFSIWLMFAMAKSHKPWYWAIPFIVSTAVFFVGLVPMMSFLFAKWIPNRLERLSQAINMPCTVSEVLSSDEGGYFIKVKDEAHKSILKLGLMYLVELALLLLSGLLILVWGAVAFSIPMVMVMKF